MYRVGFGDFFLVSLPGKDGPKHILIDCGVHAKDTGSISDAVEQMAEETNQQLALLIMTHRHADHISGFGRCKDVFQKFNVERIWMSWFEDPKDSKATALQAGIAAVATRIDQAFALRASKADEQHINMVQNITGGGTNQAALDMLHGFPGNPPIDYYTAGDAPTLPASLVEAGLEAKILGPPSDPALISKMSNTSEEYLAAVSLPETQAIVPFANAYHLVPEKYDSAVFPLIPRSTIEARVKAVQPDLLAAAAEQANNFLNNQSLVVLFTFKDKNLLFAGDAQWGNWANFLFGGLTSSTLTAQSKEILGQLNFYKVGHHGSKNATPKDALAAMRDGCVAMCSTAIGAYNEVPRDPLMTAIDQKTQHQLVRSDQVAVAGAATVNSPIPSAFTVTSNGKCGYIDYQF